MKARTSTGRSVSSMHPGMVRRDIVMCARCDLSSKPGVEPVPWVGRVPNRIAVIGEAPGYEDNAKGKLFIEAPGRLIKDLLEKNGIKSSEATWFNTVACFPDGAPSVESQKACRLHLKRQIDLVDPRWILSLGATALKFFDPDATISEVRGTHIEKGNQFVYFSFHPAAALRDPDRHRMFEKDITKFCRLVLADDWERV